MNPQIVEKEMAPPEEAPINDEDDNVDEVFEENRVPPHDNAKMKTTRSNNYFNVRDRQRYPLPQVTQDFR